jgi:hypothetical protein
MVQHVVGVRPGQQRQDLVDPVFGSDRDERVTAAHLVPVKPHHIVRRADVAQLAARDTFVAIAQDVSWFLRQACASAWESSSSGATTSRRRVGSPRLLQTCTGFERDREPVAWPTRVIQDRVSPTPCRAGLVH